MKMAGGWPPHTATGVHRDIKPANILYTDFGEPALSDFGSRTSAVDSRPTPEPTPDRRHLPRPKSSAAIPPAASDVYGLGSTILCTHRPCRVERRSGEQVVAQFLRIATEAVPDLSGERISDDIADTLEDGDARDRRDRPSPRRWAKNSSGSIASRLPRRPDGDAYRRGARHPVRQATALTVSAADRQDPAGPHQLRRSPRRAGRREGPVATSRLVTLTGIGGVGKSRLSLGPQPRWPRISPTECGS